jgi:hypothetical protein
VGHHKPVTDADQGTDRRSQSSEFRITVDNVGQLFVDGLELCNDCCTGLVDRGKTSVKNRQIAHGDAGGHIATGVTAHAVGNDEKELTRVSRVLV